MFSKIGLSWRRYRSEQHGAAAVEFALVLTLLTIPILNVVDVAVYSWTKMQVDNAAQAGVQAAWATCNDATKIPATVGSNCSTMPAAVTLAAQGTSLGTGVTVTATTENYYCVKTSTSALVVAGPVTSAKPANCSSGSIGGSASDTPGDYVLITVSYTYAPVFPAVSIAGLLTTPIIRQAWMRLG
jgi:Flp pilus assembly protein TadG